MSTPKVKRGRFRRSCRRCPWNGVYSTKGLADHAKRQHSCEKAIREAEAAERGRARMAAVDRTPKPCLHKYADHQHGTYACYTLDGCRCEPCTRAQGEYDLERTRQQSYGRWDNLVDAEPVRQHVRALMDAGMGLKRIAKAAGISNGAATKLIYGTYAPGPGGCKGNGELLRGPAKRVRKETADKLLAVRFVHSAGTRVDQADTARRLQALVALGWSGSKLAARLGILRSNFTPVLHGRRRINAETAQAVHALYLELAEQTPPEDTHRDKIAASRARRMAREHGWLPPLKIGGRLHVGPALRVVTRQERMWAEKRSSGDLGVAS